MPNYQNGKIYCIRSYQTDKVYVGSTTQTLCQRLTDHRKKYKQWRNGKYGFITSYKMLDHHDHYIELLEKCSCDCVDELRKIEGKYIRALNCVNKPIAGRTPQESNKAYRDNNKEKERKRNAKYRMKNKEKEKIRAIVYKNKNKDALRKKGAEYYRNTMKARRSIPTPCPHCGKIMMKGSISRHIRKSCKLVPK